MDCWGLGGSQASEEVNVISESPEGNLDFGFQRGSCKDLSV